jgi:hypothetical protein
MSTVRTYALLALSLALVVVVFLMVTAPVAARLEDPLVPQTVSPAVSFQGDTDGE